MRPRVGVLCVLGVLCALCVGVAGTGSNRGEAGNSRQGRAPQPHRASPLAAASPTLMPQNTVPGTVLALDPVKLYYLRPSHYCEKARAILAFKGIPFDIVNVPYNDHTEVLDVSGQDYVPFIKTADGDGVLWPDVADWAERVAPEPTLYPGPDPKNTRARSRLVESWAHNVVEETVWRFALGDAEATFKDKRERWVFVEMQERKRGPLEAVKANQPQTWKGVVDVCSIANDLLGANDYLFGAAPTLADFALYGALHPLPFTGHALPKETPQLAAWHSRVHKLAGDWPA